MRLELQENSDDCQKKLQQLTKHLQTLSFAAGGNLNQDATASRMPSFLNQKTTGTIKQLVPHGASSPSSYSSQSSSMRMQNDTSLDFVSSTSDFSTSYAGGVKIPTGAAAMATSDCFLHAKAALPQRNGVLDASLRKSTAPAAFSSRMYSAADGSDALVSDSDPPSPLRSSSAGRKSSEPAAELDDILVIQQSVLSQPLGREVDELETSLLHQDGLLKRSSPDRSRWKRRKR